MAHPRIVGKTSTVVATLLWVPRIARHYCQLIQHISTPGKDSVFSEPYHITTPVEKQRHYFANKGPSSQGYGFSSSHMDVRVGL